MAKITQDRDPTAVECNCGHPSDQHDDAKQSECSPRPHSSMQGQRRKQLVQAEMLRGLAARIRQMVAELAEQIEGDPMPRPRLSDPIGWPLPSYAGGEDGGLDDIDHGKAPMPDPVLLRQVIRQRQLRADLFGEGLFADPAWDMLLDLTAARAENKRVSITSLCIASGVPPTTALRWIGQLQEAGLVERSEDQTDRRRAFIGLTCRAWDLMTTYLSQRSARGQYLV